MGTRTIKISMDEHVPRWAKGFGRLDGPVPESAVKEWTEACEVYFGATQQFAHVLSGDMVSTGRLDMARGESEIEGAITYGGRFGEATGQMVDYVWYEVRRRGSHDFFRRALSKTSKYMEEAAGRALADAVEQVMH